MPLPRYRPTSPTRRRLTRGLAVAFVAAAAAMLIGCRERLPDAGGPFGRRVAEYVPKIEKAVGLKFKTPPKLEVRTRDEVRDFLVDRLNEPQVARELEAQTSVLKVLGLIPQTLDLRTLFVPLLTEQIIGYYDPKTKVLYVVDGAPEEYVGITIMHELIHALQDQYIDLDSLQNAFGNDDRQMAAQAVIEGQATYHQMVIMAGPSNIMMALPTAMNQIRAMIRSNQAVQPVFGSAPMVIQESLLFPYINGADFVGRYVAGKTGKSPLEDLPHSTEQVMHDSAFFGARRDPPVEVVLPPVAGATYENTMGEFGTRLFIYGHLKDVGQAASAAAGWGGDRYALFSTPAGDGIAWVSVWDTDVDAAEFVNALDGVMMVRYEVQGARAGDERVFRTRARTAVVRTRELGGKTAVLYVDVPAGADTRVLDLSRVTVR